MNRRCFGLMASASALALAASYRGASAQAAQPDISLLTTTLTPQGAERAGNSAGTIPAWSGGMTEIPAGVQWTPTASLPPDFFAADARLYEVNAANLAQYADLVSEGLQSLITTQGFSLQVFPTRRTAAAPQWVYDNIAQNIGRAQPIPGGARLGFTGGYGGVPFPIPDSDPLVAGAQIIWNHEARWNGSFLTLGNATFTVPNGQVTLVDAQNNKYVFPYYQQNSGPQSFDGYFYAVFGVQYNPSTVVGGEIISKNSSSPLQHPNITWQVLAGQGRVRKAPEVMYDTPSSYADGIVNYDEYFGFNGPLDRYDWKLLGKKEMLIPYNGNKAFHINSADAHREHSLAPEAVRWELHRVWVVEATLHAGARNVISRRMLYVDEDSWMVGVVDSWDGHGNLLRHSYLLNANFPNLPGTIYANCIAHNLQTGDYVSLGGAYADPPYNGPWTFEPLSPGLFNPQSMAAASAY